MEIASLYNKFKESTGISTDTRSIKAGQLFFALKGPNFNANKLAEQAIQKGASGAVIDDPEFSSITNTFLVKDSLSTLQELAGYHRSKLDIPVFALTGSNGKTTTKELITAVLSKKYNVIATKGNLNNHIGVPLTLLSINDEDIAVIEMGANHVGEIKSYCEIANPTHGLITNIGKAHIGEFGGFENIIRGKSELFDHLRKNQGQVFINTSNKVLNNMKKRFTSPELYPEGGKETCTLYFEEASPFLKMKGANGEILQTKLLGAYNFTNVAAAWCLGDYFNVSEDDRKSAIESYVPSNNRSQIIKEGSNTIILDAYNANPTSMEAAIKSFGVVEQDKKAVILGDMLELGEDSKQEHQKVGNDISDYGFDLIIFVGPLMAEAGKVCKNGLYFSNKEDVVEYLKENPITNTHILLKGSRSMGLETLVEELKEH